MSTWSNISTHSILGFYEDFYFENFLKKCLGVKRKKGISMGKENTKYLRAMESYKLYNSSEE